MNTTLLKSSIVIVAFALVWFLGYLTWIDQHPETTTQIVLDDPAMPANDRSINSAQESIDDVDAFTVIDDVADTEPVFVDEVDQVIGDQNEDREIIQETQTQDDVAKWDATVDEMIDAARKRMERNSGIEWYVLPPIERRWTVESNDRIITPYHDLYDNKALRDTSWKHDGINTEEEIDVFMAETYWHSLAYKACHVTNPYHCLAVIQREAPDNVVGCEWEKQWSEWWCSWWLDIVLRPEIPPYTSSVSYSHGEDSMYILTYYHNGVAVTLVPAWNYEEVAQISIDNQYGANYDWPVYFPLYSPSQLPDQRETFEKFLVIE